MASLAAVDPKGIRDGQTRLGCSVTNSLGTNVGIMALSHLTPVPPLFPLFYQVEIRHRQLLQLRS